MCSQESEQTLRSIMDAVQSNDPINTLYNIGPTAPLIIDYKERNHLFAFSHDTVSLQIEDMGNFYIPANIWVQIDFTTGARLTPSASAVILVRATDDLIIPTPVTPAVNTAIVAYSGNPTQTAAAAADTLYKFGAGGMSTISHVVIQNNTGSNVLYAFDQSTTGSTNMVYVLATGQTIFWDRFVTVLHFSSAAQQSFGGSSGITVEGFL